MTADTMPASKPWLKSVVAPPPGPVAASSRSRRCQLDQRQYSRPSPAISYLQRRVHLWRSERLPCRPFEIAFAGCSGRGAFSTVASATVYSTPSPGPKFRLPLDETQSLQGE